VPTVKEAGVNGFEVVSWNGVFAPSGTPKEVIDTVNAAMRDILSRCNPKNGNFVGMP
jgi:tripartite-type tricarboxylate transporter receptor subunit TctC